MSVGYVRSGSVALVTLDNAPVNAIDLSIRQGLMDVLDIIEAETGLEYVVLTGQGGIFAAGADAREFGADPIPPHLPNIIERMEACKVPWVAAVNGPALGGGCELVLGCHYTIAAPAAKFGLPEVTLGVVPGAGGTQRLPRRVGMSAALELISTGKSISAVHAGELGLIHDITEDPVAKAMALDRRLVDKGRTVSALPPPSADETAMDNARSIAERKFANQVAPQRAIELVALSTSVPFEEAMRRERASFIELRNSDQARSLRHLFFAERAAGKMGNWAQEPHAFDTVALVGGGTMGASIAYALLSAGLQVILLEQDADGIERANSNVKTIIDTSLKQGFIDPHRARACWSRFEVASDYSRAKHATLAIEAAFESMPVKKDIFAALEANLPAEAVLATNTSYLDINEIAASVKDPARVVGLHFFAPAHIMKLLEVVRGDATSHRVLATGFSLAKRLRKVPVLSGVCDGFIGNRILARYREAADTVLLEASTPWEVDEAMVRFGYKMGPYEAQDLSGLDIAYANRRRQDGTRDKNRRYIPIADRMVELGKLGRKSGAGWYRYPVPGHKIEDPIVADLAIEEAHFAGVVRRDFSEDDIRDRLLLAMINEASDILYEGIADAARDIDLVTVLGYGFPRWRGGLMFYAETLGARNIFDRLCQLSAEDPVAWRPSPLLQWCLEHGKSFSDWPG